MRKDNNVEQLSSKYEVLPNMASSEVSNFRYTTLLIIKRHILKIADDNAPNFSLKHVFGSPESR